MQTILLILLTLTQNACQFLANTLLTENNFVKFYKQYLDCPWILELNVTPVSRLSINEQVYMKLFRQLHRSSISVIKCQDFSIYLAIFGRDSFIKTDVLILSLNFLILCVIYVLWLTFKIFAIWLVEKSTTWAVL